MRRPVGFTVGLFVLTALLPRPAAAAGTGWLDMNSQVVSLYQAGQYEEALPLAQEALVVAESIYGSDHPYVSTSLNNLAALYRSAGRLDEAETLYRRALAIDLNLFGEQDANVAIDRHNLAQLRFVTAQPLPPTGDKPEAPEEAPDPKGGDWDWDYWNSAGLTPPGTRPRTRGEGEEEAAPEKGRSRFLGGELESSVRGGYRSDDLVWSIAGNQSGTSPNILSELTWDNVESYTINGDALLTWKFLALRGAADYGWIFAGDNQDSDYLGNNRTFEFSRSNNNSDDGHVADISGGVGIPWTPAPGSSYDFRFIPLAGYSYHRQFLTITDGFQTIPSTGPFDNLHSRYEAEWDGPWLGFDTSIKVHEKFRFFGGFEYHWASYLAKARWNLRTDFAQPESFRHTADGRGAVGTVGLAYHLTDKWLVQADAKFQRWVTGHGIDRTFLVGGGTSDTQLNEVEWTSYSASLGLRRRF